MKMVRVTLLLSMQAVLGGCTLVPVSPGPLACYGPSIGIGIYSGGGGHGRSCGRR